jgi:hypothetical protein
MVQNNQEIPMRYLDGLTMFTKDCGTDTRHMESTLRSKDKSSMKDELYRTESLTKKEMYLRGKQGVQDKQRLKAEYYQAHPLVHEARAAPALSFFQKPGLPVDIGDKETARSEVGSYPLTDDERSFKLQPDNRMKVWWFPSPEESYDFPLINKRQPQQQPAVQSDNILEQSVLELYKSVSSKLSKNALISFKAAKNENQCPVFEQSESVKDDDDAVAAFDEEQVVSEPPVPEEEELDEEEEPTVNEEPTNEQPDSAEVPTIHTSEPLPLRRSPRLLAARQAAVLEPRRSRRLAARPFVSYKKFF